jgi:hypothetical protein
MRYFYTDLSVTQTSHIAKTKLKRRKIKHQAQEVSKSLFFDRKALLKTEESLSINKSIMSLISSSEREEHSVNAS